jgi:predicted O-methyltransferase YrrM
MTTQSSGGLRDLARRARHIPTLVMSPPEVNARQAELSMLFSADDDTGGPSQRLVSLALRAAERALTIDLTSLAAREPGGGGLANLWPGEHYRLLAGLAEVLEARCVVEIGTGTGMGALSLLAGMPEDGRLVTFDPVDWRGFPAGVLRQDDFGDGRLEHLTDDLSQPAGAAKHRDLLGEADLIFVDAAKDGEMEYRFLDLFNTIDFKKPVIIMFDDIRLWPMLAIWRSVSRPKLDLTSFGHWSGTGLIDYSP